MNIGSLFVVLGLKATGYQREMKAAEREAKRAMNAINREIKKVDIGLAAIRTGAVAAGFAYIEQNILGVAGAAQQMRISFDTVTKGHGAEWFDKINKRFIDLPVAIQGMQLSFRKLTAMGLQPTTEQMLILADTASVLGGGDTLDGIALAIGQIATKGKLMSQEVRQLAERGIPAYEILAQKLGITGDKLEKTGHEAIDGRTAINALFEGMMELFGGQSVRMLDTYNGQLQVMKNQFWDIKRISGEIAMDSVVYQMKELNAELVKNKQSISQTVGAGVEKIASIGIWVIEHNNAVAAGLEVMFGIWIVNNIIKLTSWIAGLSGNLWRLAKVFIPACVSAYETLIIKMMLAGGRIEALAVAISRMTGVWGAFAPVATAAATALAPLAALLGATAAALFLIDKHSKSGKNVLNSLGVEDAKYNESSKSYEMRSKFSAKYGNLSDDKKQKILDASARFSRGLFSPMQMDAMRNRTISNLEQEKKNNQIVVNKEEMLKAAEERAKRLAEIEKEYADWRISNMDDGLGKEFAAMNKWYEKEVSKTGTTGEALVRLEQWKTDKQASIVQDWQNQMQKERDAYNEEEKRRLEEHANDLAAIQSDSANFRIAQIQDEYIRELAEIDKWFADYQKAHADNLLAINAAEQFADEQRRAAWESEIERRMKDEDDAVRKMENAAVSFGQTWGSVLGDAVLQSGNAFDNIGRAFSNTLASMAAEASAAGIMAGLFNMVTGGTGGFGRGFFAAVKNVFGFRASGGSVSAGSPYIVGEEGPEPFIPKQAGYVVSYDDAINAIRGKSAGTTITDNSRWSIHFHDDSATSMMSLPDDQFSKQFKRCVRDGKIIVKAGVA